MQPRPGTLLTFGVAAVHQARLSDLDVEGFVLLVLLVVDYSHLDDFTEEEEEEEEEEQKGKRKREEEKKSEDRTDRKSENQEETGKEQPLVFPQHIFLFKTDFTPSLEENVFLLSCGKPGHFIVNSANPRIQFYQKLIFNKL